MGRFSISLSSSLETDMNLPSANTLSQSSTRSHKGKEMKGEHTEQRNEYLISALILDVPLTYPSGSQTPVDQFVIDEGNWLGHCNVLL
jgi:hypothetical protein